MTSTNGMFAIFYGPMKTPKDTAAWEASEATRRAKVVNSEPGCMLYQTVKDKKGQYFIFELYKDQAALDTHFKGMGAPGAMPLDKIKYDADGGLKIFPVVGGFLHQGESKVANWITLPINPAKAAAFEAATKPALSGFDATEPGTHAYLLLKRPDETEYYFMELFADNAAIAVHGKSDTFKAMGKRQGAAKANDRSRKAKFLTGMSVVNSTPRKTVSASAGAKM